MSYGGIPASYNPKASRHDTAAGFDPKLAEALAAKTAANSPWPAKTAGYDNSSMAKPEPDYITAEAARIRAAKPAADILAFASRLEAKAVELRLEAAENSRLERLAESQAGWLTAEAENRNGREAEAVALEAKAEALRARKPILEAREAVSMENRQPQIKAEAAEAKRLDGLAASIRAIEKTTAARIAAEAREAEAGREAEAANISLRLASEAREAGERLAFGQAEAAKRAAVISDICESEREAARNIEADKAAEANIAKTAEAGERIKLTAILPADMRKPEHREALAVLEFDLTMQFGGYTVSKARGGWLDGSGEIVRDSSQVYSCSFDPAARDYREAEAKLIGYFVAAGEALGEEWLHIERAIFTACHRKAS